MKLSLFCLLCFLVFNVAAEHPKNELNFLFSGMIPGAEPSCSPCPSPSPSQSPCPTPSPCPTAVPTPTPAPCTCPVDQVVGYQTVALTASQNGLGAPINDTNLVNPWGLVFSPNSPAWISDNGSGKMSIIADNGAVAGLVVNAGGDPLTGMVYNPITTDFFINNTANTASGSASFIAASESGKIWGWAPSVNTGTAFVAVDLSEEGSIFKDLAIAANGANNNLYVADFGTGKFK